MTFQEGSYTMSKTNSTGFRLITSQFFQLMILNCSRLSLDIFMNNLSLKDRIPGVSFILFHSNDGQLD